MNASLKWIGGTTLAVAVFIGSAAVAGRGLEAQEVMDTWLAAEDVLSDDPQTVELAGGDPVALEFRSEPVVQETPAYDADNPFVIKRVLPITRPNQIWRMALGR